MRLFLIRHGETVDNVASLYAGSRDSALTNHGVLQCRRLAEHLARTLYPSLPSSSSVTATTSTASSEPPSHGDHANVYFFSSNLQRAVKTAEAIRDAVDKKQQRLAVKPLQQLPELREKAFGTGEGQSFATGARNEQPHIGAESPQAMRTRVDTFLNDHLLPLTSPTIGHSGSVVVVAHGIILSHLFRRLCEHLPRNSITLAPEAQRMDTKSDAIPILPSWSNTGCLEATLSFSSASPHDWSSVKMHVLRVNATDHLKGLRKTRGGIGSARFDDKQKTMESFFTSKKRKLADAAE